LAGPFLKKKKSKRKQCGVVVLENGPGVKQTKTTCSMIKGRRGKLRRGEVAKRPFTQT